MRGKKSEDIKSIKSKGCKRRGNIRIVVSPVYVGNRPMEEAIVNAVADKMMSTVLGKAG